MPLHAVRRVHRPGPEAGVHELQRHRGQRRVQGPVEHAVEQRAK